MQQGGEQEVLQGVKKTILVLSGMSSSLGTHPTVLEIRLHDTVPEYKWPHNISRLLKQVTPPFFSKTFSGKGGVGKSTVAVQLALAHQQAGLKVSDPAQHLKLLKTKHGNNNNLVRLGSWTLTCVGQVCQEYSE